ncbi:QRFP-like peptide receptor, partial [Saccostrea cucullata]|uniref:QRFP-like peptide receptor n=1 Tax=Saccostrea cuccullata TaxID=36930 RepID=UPI002ED0665E
CIAFFTYSWRLGEFLCKFVNYLQNLSIICSVMTLTGLSLERYYAILHPIKSKYVCTISLARRSVACIWILSVIMATPTLAGQTHKLVGTHRNAHWCILEWDNIFVQRLYGVYMFLIILFVPFVILSFTYTSICRKLWKMDGRDQNIGNVNDNQETVQLRRVLSRRDKKTITNRGIHGDDTYSRKQVVKMLVTIIILFMISWGPITTNNLLVSFDILDNLHMGTLKHVRQAFYVLSYFNSCVNPIVYGFMSKNFRKAFIIALGFMCFGRRQRSRFLDETVVRFSTENRSSSVVQSYQYRISKQFTREQSTYVH